MVFAGKIYNMPTKKQTKHLTFEDCYDEIEAIVEKFRYKWTLSSVAWLSFDDLKNSVLAHVHRKWSLYDQNQGLGGWVATITKNQLTNSIRNSYGNFARPCRNCIGNRNVGEGQCQIFGDQDPKKCGLLAHWEKSKQQKHNIELPLALEYHSNEVTNKPFAEVNYDLAVPQLNEKLKPILTKYEYKVYVLLFVEHKPKEEVAKIMGYKTTEKNRQVGYRRILGIEKIIYDKARKLVYDGEIDF